MMYLPNIIGDGYNPFKGITKKPVNKFTLQSK